MKKELSRLWLRAASVLVVVFGLVSAAASFPPTSGPWLFLFDLLKGPLDGDPSGFDQSTRAVNAVLGGVMVGWGLLLFLLTKKAGPLEAAFVRRVILLSTLGWFAIDSLGSFLAEMPGNAVFNLLFLAVLLPPLVFVKEDQNHRVL